MSLRIKVIEQRVKPDNGQRTSACYIINFHKYSSLKMHCGIFHEDHTVQPTV
jgi:hypothetical protein